MIRKPDFPAEARCKPVANDVVVNGNFQGSVEGKVRTNQSGCDE